MNSFVHIDELLTNPTTATGSTPFRRATLKTLVNMIYGASGSVSTQLSSLKTSTAVTPLTAADLRAKTYNKTANKSIVVRLGGLDWIVTYVSNDTDGNLIATLWLSNNHQEAWGWNGTGGEDYSDEIGLQQRLNDDYDTALVNGGLYSIWSGDWYYENRGSITENSTYPADMYGTSYIRVETLNNPNNRTYATDSETLTNGTPQSSDHIFSLYTVASKGLTNYLVTPNKMPWINAVQDPSLIGEESLHSNDSLSTASGSYGVYGSLELDYTSIAGYTNWGTDYLFLPSIVEMGLDDTNDGLWETNNAERSTYDGCSEYISDNVTENTEVYPYSWSRSVLADYGSSAAYSVDGCGSDIYGDSGPDVDWYPNAVRPCLLLNLDSAADAVDADTNAVMLMLDRQGGIGGSLSITVSNNTLPSITPPTRTGYKFDGYYTSTNGGGTKIYNADGTPVNSTSTFASDTTLYAKWNVIVLTLDKQGGTGGTTSVTLDTNTLPDITPPTRTGYKFGGYYTSTNGAGTRVYLSSGVSGISASTFTSNTVLYAKWDAIVYNVKYNANGGSGSMSNTTHTYDSAKNLSLCNYTRRGYLFKGWATSASGSVAYADQANVVNLSSSDYSTINLYAVWEAYSGTMISITFDMQVPTTVGCKVHWIVPNGNLPAMNETVSRSGYTFGGYYSLPNGGGTQVYNSNGTPTSSDETFTSDITLYAKWTPRTYTVYYKANGGTGTMSNSTHTAGVASYLNSNTFTRSGYTFKGWARYSSYANDGRVDYYDGQSVINMNSGNSEYLYAVWRSNDSTDITITFDNQSATFAGTQKYFVASGTQIKNLRAIEEPSRTGYTFGGYYTQQNGGGTQVYKSSSYSTYSTETFTSNTTLYAQWTPISYTVKYDANGGTGTMSDSIHTYDVAKNLTTNTFTKTDSFFAGWSTSPIRSVAYTNGQSVSNLTASAGSTITLYAVWEGGVGDNTTTLIFDNQSATTAGTTSVTVENNTLPNITPPTKDYYTFGGYYTSTNGGGTKIYNADGTPVNSTSTFTSSTTLYAKWTGFTYYIKYNANGGSGTMSNSTHEYGTYKNLTANAFTRTGYTFSGWATSSNGAKVYNNSASVRNLTTTSGATVNLYAVWQGVTVTITLNNQSATTAGSTSVSATYNAALSNITPPSGGPSRHVFAGYYTQTNGAGQKIYNADGTPSVTKSTFASNVTLYAYWAPYLNATVTGATTQFADEMFFDKYMPNATIKITPATGYHISQLSFDNTHWIDVIYCKADIGNTPYAMNVTYFANEQSNVFALKFEMMLHDFEDDGCIIIYLKTVSGNYSGLKTAGATKLEGVAVQSTFGGKAFIVGDDVENLADNDTITCAAFVTQYGYEFKHWTDSSGAVLSTAASVRFKKSEVMDSVVVAVFAPITSGNINTDLDNMSSE